MHVNKKKPVTFKNRTNYFSPDSTRVKVTVASPESYNSRRTKIEGYETRLYWQYKYCESVDGQAFFYTLTYNDEKIPRQYGINCFDYQDLRELLTGGFRKQLLRNYGTTFKYFIGAELGDGKGSRGMHNNPHYHIIFFLEPSPFQIKRVKYVDLPDGVYQRNGNLHKKGEVRYKKERREEVIDVPYKKISPKDFRHLVRLYWQGFDEDVVGYRSYKNARFGIAKEGKNCGLIYSYSACVYCAKYVCKDALLKQHEDVVLRMSRWTHYLQAKREDKTYEDFLHTVLFDMYNTPLNPSKTKWCFDDARFIEHLIPGTFSQKNLVDDWSSKIRLMYEPYVRQIISQERLWNEFNKFVHSRIDSLVQEDLNEWRNRFCNKCRISQGVGEFALDNIKDKSCPLISVPCKDGIKYRTPCLYFYRKLFCDVVKDKKGSNLYILNEAGKDYKLKSLAELVNKCSDKAYSNLALVLDNSGLFDKMVASDVNTEVQCSFSEFVRSYDKLKRYVNPKEICKRYAQYKLVYKDRFFKYQHIGDGSIFDFPTIDILCDYERFLVPTFYSVSRNDLLLDLFLEDTPEGYLPYSQHPYFLRCIGVFCVLDLCADYFFVQKDDKEQKDAEERARVKRFHDKKRLEEFYLHFK